MTPLQEAQALLLEQSESNLKAITVILRAMSPGRTERKPAAQNRSIIGALKGKRILPPDFAEQSRALDEEISQEFYGECP